MWSAETGRPSEGWGRDDVGLTFLLERAAGLAAGLEQESPLWTVAAPPIDVREMAARVSCWGCGSCTLIYMVSTSAVNGVSNWLALFVQKPNTKPMMAAAGMATNHAGIANPLERYPLERYPLERWRWPFQGWTSS